MEGSIISSTRILIAAAFGPVLLTGEMLPMGGWVVVALIFLAKVLLAHRLRQGADKQTSL